MKNGCILCGGTGSGKSRTAIAYYYQKEGGRFISGGDLPFTELTKAPRDLYIITTAKKRDDHDWDMELSAFWLHPDPKLNHYTNKIVVDSWNNIKKYKDTSNAFFIFDEQRVVGNGTWVTAFLSICKRNDWILLSATPGDTWSDYIPVFVANGFYKNRTEFNRDHVVFNSYVKYPLIDRYLGIERLNRLRYSVLITMDFDRSTIQHHETIYCDYNILEYKKISKDRWNPFTSEPIKNASEYCYTLRKIVNSDSSREDELLNLFKKHNKMIIFYNYDYELEILRSIKYSDDYILAEWNGHKHQPIPESVNWVYLVQYNAGSEGWNCIKTDTIVFYSQNYSYKVITQATGRIDRMNTTYIDLYFYHLKSRAGIDIAIGKAIGDKKKFNERGFVPGW